MVRTVGAVNISEEQIIAGLARIGEGLTLKQSCKLAKFDYVNVVRRIGQSNDLKQLHSRAREEYVRTRVQDMHDIAKNPKIDPQRARVMIDVIKWEAARVIPKEFGDRGIQEVTVTNNTTLSQRMSAARKRAQNQTTAMPKAEDAE